MHIFLALLLATGALFVPNSAEGRERHHHRYDRHHVGYYYGHHKNYHPYVYYQRHGYHRPHRGFGFFFDMAPGVRIVIQGGKEHKYYSPRHHFRKGRHHHYRHHRRHGRH